MAHTTPDHADLAQRFAYHPPSTPETVQAHERVRALLGEAAQQLGALLPDGRERSLAITHLEDALMWANASIARNGGPRR
jgi:hypothetical protein